MISALVKGDLAALRLLPRMWRKRRDLDVIRRLNAREVRRLILSHRLSWREVA
jgi:hypothetical protein